MDTRPNLTRGYIAAYVAVMVVAMMLLLAALFQVSLAAFTTSLAWDIRRQRQIEARAVASATKEAILSVAETAPTTSTATLSSAIATRVGAVSSGTSVIVSNASNNTITLPDNPQFPFGSPVNAAVGNFSSLTPVGRNLQALLSAGRFADLGTRVFAFTETNSAIPGETTQYDITARLFSVPLGNFTWIAYGQPSAVGGVSSGTPNAPTFTRPSSFVSPLANSYAGESGTFPSLFNGLGTGLPYFYRDLVSLTWNAFEFWTSLTYQNALLTSAGASGTFDFTKPDNVPSGVIWNGSVAAVNLSVTTAGLIVFVDSLGTGVVEITGSASNGLPVVIAVRNFTSTKTQVRLLNNNSRTVLLYAPNTTITPQSANISIRGALLMFPTTAVDGAFSVSGLVAYPQLFAAAPNLTAYPDTQAQTDLENITPRVLLLSTRSNLP